MEQQTLPKRDSLGFLANYFSGYEPFTPSVGATVQVPKYLLAFSEWRGAPIANSYRKPVIDYRGEPLYAELVILRMFQERGWSGVWVDTYRKKYRVGLPETSAPVDLPADKEKLIASIRSKTETSGGCWDVFVWKDDQILFLELKRKKKDAIKDSQRRWLGASIASGLAPSNFALIEWT